MFSQGDEADGLRATLGEIGFPVAPANAGGSRDVGLIRGLGRSPGEGNGNSLQYSCLDNPMDRGTWWATATGLQRNGLNHHHVENY